MNPKHYNYICLDPTCDNLHCKNTSHYDTTKFTRDIIKKAANSNKKKIIVKIKMDVCVMMITMMMKY